MRLGTFWHFANFAFFRLGLLAVTTVAHADDWLQFGFDAQHSGVNANERGYSTSGNQLTYAITLTDQVFTQPVFLSEVTTPSGVKDLLFFLGTTGKLHTFDASTGAEVWSVALFGGGTTLRAVPAIDPNRQYIYSPGLDGKVHKLNVADSSEILDANWPEISSSKPTIERVTSALTIAKSASGATYLIVPSGSYGDGGDYQVMSRPSTYSRDSKKFSMPCVATWQVISSQTELPV